jgi:hypothetical protein
VSFATFPSPAAMAVAMAAVWLLADGLFSLAVAVVDRVADAAGAARYRVAGRRYVRALRRRTR